MTTLPPELAQLLATGEDERLEIKEAKHTYAFEELAKYSGALANEGGGRMVLGVTDARPRRIVGTKAFPDPGQTTARLMSELHVRVTHREYGTPDGRVLVFDVARRPAGTPVQYRGQYLMRAGSSLVPMTAETLRQIFDEIAPDFSATLCPHASLDDLDPAAIRVLRASWAKKTRDPSFENLTEQRVLHDLGLTDDSGVTYAALVLLGRDEALSRLLPDAEIVYEYRSSEKPGPAQFRLDLRRGFLLISEQIWDRVNSRNDVQHIQEGLFVRDIPTFSEVVVREALLNAVSHRDYRRPGSIFLRQYSDRLDVESPGGFPPGVTAENCLERQVPRNRRIAEVLMKAGFVERAGQGMDRMFESCIREGKPLPSFDGTDDHRVKLTLFGQVRHPELLRSLEEIGQEMLASFSVEDFLVVDHLFRNEPVEERYRARLPRLVELGVVERLGKGRGTRYVLARRVLRAAGKTGVYTRRRGLDREAQKALLAKHIRDNAESGTPLHELKEVLPNLSGNQVQSLVQELRKEGRVRLTGKTKGARWYPS